MKPGHPWWIITKGNDLEVFEGGAVPYKMPDWYHDWWTQNELEKYSYYTQRSIFPNIVYQGKVVTPSELGKILGKRLETVIQHVRRFGATRYKEHRWELDFEEYVQRCQAFDDERERKLIEKEQAAETRRRERIAVQRTPEWEEKRKAAIREYWAKKQKQTEEERKAKDRERKRRNPVVMTDEKRQQLKEYHNRKRREAGIPARVLNSVNVQVITPKPAELRTDELWFRGELTTATALAEVFKVSKLTMLQWLRQGDVTLNGELVERRERTCTPTIYGNGPWKVCVSYKGKKYSWYQGPKLEKAEACLAEILVDDKWKKDIDKKLGLS